MRYAEVGADRWRLRWLDVPGNGARPRVFLHGLGSAGFPHLAEAAVHPAMPRTRAVVPDFLGHGLSDRPTDFSYTLEAHADVLAEALDADDTTAADVIGHSMGGAVALVLAQRRPDLVRRLVLSEPNLDPWDGVGSPTIARQSEAQFVDRGFAQLTGSSTPERAAVLRLVDPAALHRSATALCFGSAPMMREILYSLKIPVTLLWGTESRPLAEPEKVRAAGIQVVPIEHSAHSIPAQQPDLYARAVAAALAVQ